MDGALKARRRIYTAGAMVAAGMWLLIWGVDRRVDGPMIAVDVPRELVLGGVAGFCLLAALFLLSMKPKLVDEIIDKGRRRESDDSVFNLRALARQLSLMGAGLGWSILTAGYVAVSLTGLYRTYGAFVVLAAVVAGAAGARIRGLLAYAQQMGVNE